MREKLLVVSCWLFVVFWVGCGRPDVVEADYEVVPLPQQIEREQGQPFVLKSSTKVVYPAGSESLERVAEFLSDYIYELTGKRLAVSDQLRGDNVIVLDTALRHDNGEAYAIRVSEEKIEVQGAGAAGVFYGVQTLRKSIVEAAEGKEIRFPTVHIEDYPRFPYRGMMLDVGRHLFPLEFIKKYIDLLALHNMNRFHWHLTDDQGWRIEIRKYPRLTEIGAWRKETVIGKSGEYDGKPYGGFYTQEETREIVDYARERFITVIPEIDLPGHMTAALTAYPELGCTGGPYEVERDWGIFREVLCAGNDQTFTFIEDVLSEIMEIFPSEYIHIGGDECPKVRWRECAKCQARIRELGVKEGQGHSAEEQLQSDVIARVERFLNSRGRQIIGWDEILEGGLAPNATVMSWQGINGGRAAARQHNKAIMSPTSHLYFNYYQTTDIENVPLANGGYIPIEKVYEFEPVPEDLEEENRHYIIGVQANLWTEYIETGEQVEYMVLPRMDALTEVQWCEPERKDYNAFLGRLFRMLNYYNKIGYNYSPTVYDIRAEVENNQGVIEVKFSTIDHVPVYYTLDGTMPTLESKKYTDPLSLSASANLTAAVFRFGVDTPLWSRTFDINQATARPITLKEGPHRTYTYGGAPILVDGLSGNTNNYKDGTWIGFNRGDIEATIDLTEEKEISGVDVNTFVCTRDWVFGATGLTVAVSDDNREFRTIARQSFPEATEGESEVKKVSVSFEKVKTRYVRVTIEKTKTLPAWHAGSGGLAFIFIDEIRII